MNPLQTLSLDSSPRVAIYILMHSLYESTGIKAKVENKAQYEQYLEELEPLRKELGIELKENLYPELP